MTITETGLLKAAAGTFHGGVSVTVSKGVGVRSTAAIRSLVARGLMATLMVSNEKETHRGRITRSTTLTAFITDEGRKALEA